MGRHLASIAPQVDDLFYLLNDSTDDTGQYLHGIPHVEYNTGDPYSDRQRRSIANMAEVFNKWTDLVLQRDWDYLMLWSSDMVAGPGMVERLYDTHLGLGERSVVGPVYPTGERTFNVFEESNGEYERSPLRNQPWRCFSTGCALYPRAAVESGARHADVPQGHVFAWYKGLVDEGFEVWAEPRLRVEHHMAPDKVYTWDGR